MEQSDSRYFSQRAKHISQLNQQPSPAIVKRTLPSACFQFSNRTYVPSSSSSDTQVTPVGRGHGNAIVKDHCQSISKGRGRTTVPLSSFILQKDNLSPPKNSTTSSRPMFVMHDEVQFVRPYFGPPSNNDLQSSSISHKREILLSALKEIESGLKTL
ncbi:unnamed protein product [Rotaria socialis]|uniref:Uncharacterized protein n=1 Tax=Rotaria socialis TaxID=392032 RepID=A0A817WSI4_9BILA|nr:unnamed protein product [Rotaria socialis]CAF4819778.1 unnamed protein product [Rotaria socialis]